MKIYRKLKKEPYSFLTNDAKFTASDPVRFKKNLFRSYKNKSS